MCKYKYKYKYYISAPNSLFQTTAQLKLRYQLYKMDTKWYGNFLSTNLAKRPLIKTLSKALLASRKAQ